METKILKTKKQVNELIKGAKVEVNQIFNNPFAIVKNLNNLYLEKNTVNISGVVGCSKANFMQVCEELKKISGNNKPFDVHLLQRNSFGIYCTFHKVSGYKVSGYKVTKKSIVTLLNGYEQISWNVEDETSIVAKPITLTIKAYFNVFSSIVKDAIFANIDAEKAIKEIDSFERDRKTCIKVFGESYVNSMTNEQITEKARIIRAA